MKEHSSGLLSSMPDKLDMRSVCDRKALFAKGSRKSEEFKHFMVSSVFLILVNLKAVVT